jgi:hypothetical protein
MLTRTTTELINIRILKVEPTTKRKKIGDNRKKVAMTREIITSNKIITLAALILLSTKNQ